MLSFLEIWIEHIRYPYFFQNIASAEKAQRKKAISEIYEILRRKRLIDKGYQNQRLPDSFTNSVWGKLIGTKGGFSNDAEKRPLLKVLDDKMLMLFGEFGDQWDPRKHPENIISALEKIAKDLGVNWKSSRGTQRPREEDDVIIQPSAKRSKNVRKKVKSPKYDSSEVSDEENSPVRPQIRRRIQRRAVRSDSDEGPESQRTEVQGKREDSGGQGYIVQQKASRSDSDDDKQSRGVLRIRSDSDEGLDSTISSSEEASRSEKRGRVQRKGQEDDDLLTDKPVKKERKKLQSSPKDSECEDNDSSKSNVKLSKGYVNMDFDSD